ncbi:MAG: hypothetical protein R3E76_01275 [Planctomycetota bacterium]
MARRIAFLFCIGLTFTACASTNTEPPEPEPLLTDTTLTRYDGSAISMEELESIRYSSIATALTIARLERELREPWAETRTPEEILRAVTNAEQSDARLATTLWETAEPKPSGSDRAPFQEFGFYSNQMMPLDFSPRAKPETLELFIDKLLSEHTDASSQGKLLAAWRHFSPAIDTRGDAYLASVWRIELDYIKPITVQLVESLMGPHLRSTVVSADGVSFPGPVDSFENYSASSLLLDLVTPGGSSPVKDAIEAMSSLSDGRPTQLPFRVSDGRREPVDELDSRFLQAALRGLQGGAADVEALPAAATRLTVTFSYLIDLGEARSTLSFRRVDGKWELELFDYEPAAASLVGGNARLDLMPGVRELVSRNRGR